MKHTGPETIASRNEFLIKVCGITNLEDALISVKAGANALGFNFYPQSPRFIDPADAAKIIQKLPGTVLKVAVVVIESAAEDRGGKGAPLELRELREIVKTGIEAVQIHGANRQAEVPELEIRTIVATSPAGASEFSHHEIIIDSSWGSGQLADWKQISDILDRPYILSGGLTPDNIGQALKKLDPAGVDVCSGVEESPGKKDLAKLESFLSIVGSVRHDSGSDC